MSEDKKDQIKVSAKEKLRLKHIIKELEQYRGRHTELVSVYIPAGYDIVKIINHLQQEQGTATNIKSAGTRNNVISALERMVQHLKLFKQTPPHGLAVFSGNVAEREGAQDFKVWSLEPPVPLNLVSRTTSWRRKASSTMIAERTSITAARLAIDKPDLILRPPLGEFRFLEFSRAEEIITIGYESAREQLKLLTW